MASAHSVTAWIALQASLVIATVLGCRSSFGQDRLGAGCWLAFATAFAVDPLVGIYTRFYMTDVLASLALFAFFLLGSNILTYGHSASRTAATVAVAVVAVFLRVACVPIEVMALVLFELSSTLRAGGVAAAVLHRRLRFVSLIGISGASLLALGLSNAVVFGDRFGHQPFLNRHSGAFLMGVFAPLLVPDDFSAVGVPISLAEYDRLHVSDFSRRAAQVWSPGDDHVLNLVRHRLGGAEAFDGQTDARLQALVRHAMRRDPAGAARIVAITAGQYFNPALWARYAPNEMGQDRALPPALVGLINQRSSQKLSASDNRTPSLLMAEFLSLAAFYPLILGAAVVAALFALSARCTDPMDRLFAGATIGGIVALGLYSNYVIARYAIPAVMTFYLLAARLAQRYLPSFLNRLRVVRPR